MSLLFSTGLLLAGSPSEAFTLPSGGDLAAAVAAASPGDTIILEAGGIYDIAGKIGIAKDLTIRTQTGVARATLRSGDGTGNYVIMRDQAGRWRWLPLEGADISGNGGDPSHLNYVGPHVDPNGSIDLTNVTLAKGAGEDFNDWPAGADPSDYEVLRGAGGDGLETTDGVLNLHGLRLVCFDAPLIASGGELVIDDCVVLGARKGVDMNPGSDVTVRDTFMSGGAQNAWTWLEVKSGELDGVGKRTWVICRDATGTLTMQRCTAHDFFDGVVGNPSYLTMVLDQITTDGRMDDLEQVQADTRGPMTVSRAKIRGTSIGGNATATGADGSLRIFEDSVITNFREMHSYGFPRWRILQARHNSPVDPAHVRRCTYIERGGVNGNDIYLNFVFGAPWYTKPTRHQIWEDVALVMATNAGKIGRDYDRAGAGELEITGSAILNIDGGTLTFANGGDFQTWRSRADPGAELITDTGYTAEQVWADPRLISGRFGRTVGAV
ncbi:MAG: hypothetical protein R3349_08820, partial [Geminicoccaceae bacterium]|nr:hypothetical protein [Geminicoccaceae bacterium]